MTRNALEAAAEAILFTIGDAVELAHIADALEVSREEAREIIASLQEKYEADDRGVTIIELDNAFQMCSKPSTYEYLIRIAKQPKHHVLTDVVLETLSIIAYKQPVTRGEIEKIRGVSCSHAINKLIDYDLIREVGRLDAPGRPILFGTTEEFLRCFAVQNTDELPVLSAEQIEEFKEEVNREVHVEVGV